MTLRAATGVPSLRGDVPFAAIRSALAASSSEKFRVLQFSVQADHVHLLVEASGSTGLARGLQGLAIRAAKAVNRVLARAGAVWGDRYHARALATPREVRNALLYVLQNWKKHIHGACGLDPRSSAAWFAGWRTAVASAATAPVATARTWLARIGWRRHGLLDVREGPRRRRGRPSGRRRVHGYDEVGGLVDA